MSRPVQLVVGGARLGDRYCDLVVDGGTVRSIVDAGAGPDARQRIEADGASVIPGLHDHHLHLLALAARRQSLDLGRPAVEGADDLAEAIRAAHGRLEPREWIRAAGYDELVSGGLDALTLESLAPGRRVRVQHRSGAMWVLSAAALDELGIVDWPDQGVERDSDGAPTGRLFGLDDRIRSVVEPIPLDLVSVSAELAGYGVTGLTDATVTTTVDDLALMARLRAEGGLVQRVVATGPVDLGGPFPDGIVEGPVKVVLADHSLPGPESVANTFEAAHARGRPVAVHCVTYEALLVALLAWEQAGALAGDRIEHGAVIPPEEGRSVRDLGLTVVTQPNFVAERGDLYRATVDPRDLPYLYRCGTLLEDGIPVGGGTDAPFGHPDPWRAVAAAVERTDPQGVVVGPAEKLDPNRALALFTSPPADPGGAPRRLGPGEPADMCVLDAPLDQVLESPGSWRVRETVVGGVVVHQQG